MGPSCGPFPSGRQADGEISTQLTAIGPDGELADLVDELFERTATRPGRVSRPASATRELLRDRPWRHRDGEPNRIIVARRQGRATGYALLRRMPKWEAGSPTGEVIVTELVGDDAATLHALWSRVLNFDLMTRGRRRRPSAWTTRWSSGWSTSAAPRRGVRTACGCGWWTSTVRSTARGYGADVDVVLAVEDDFCPWNAGRWRLTVQGGEATCAATTDPADLTVAVRDLAAAYLGGHALAALERAGLVGEHTPGAVDALSAAMRGAVGPAVPQMF